MWRHCTHYPAFTTLIPQECMSVCLAVYCKAHHLHPMTCHLKALVISWWLTNSVSPPSSAIARIQFRLPDGSSFTNQFPSETQLQEARQFAAQVCFVSMVMIPRTCLPLPQWMMKARKCVFVWHSSVSASPPYQLSLFAADEGNLWAHCVNSLGPSAAYRP